MINETDLLIRLSAGDPKAFAELVAAYQKRVLNICYRFLLSREDAEDVSQEVFLEICHSIRNFRKESGLSTWIYRIAVSKSLDELKKQSRKKRITSVGKTLGLEVITNWIAGHERPDRELEDREGFELLIKALDRLQDNQRIALTLSKIEGCTNAEIADTMHTTVTAVDSLIYRAKQNLKIFLKPERQNLK